MNKKKELVKNTVIIFLGKACTQLISFFLLPLYTGYLTTKEYGIVDLIHTYSTLLIPLITVELEMSVFRYLIDARGKDNDTKKVMSNNFIILGMSLLIFTILYLIVTCFWKFDYRFIILINLFVCTITGNLLQVARGIGKTIDYSIACIITGVMTIISNIILIVFMGLRADGMIISMTIANGLGALYLFIRLRMYKYLDFRSYNKKIIGAMFKYSIPLIPNNVSWWIISVSDRSIISIVLGAASNGIYAISNKFPTLISSIMAIFNMSWCESATLHIDSSDRDNFFSDVCNNVVKLFSALGIGMIACMPFVFPILINNKYNDAYIYIPILVLGVIFNVVASLYSSIYLAKKLTKEVAFTSVMGAIINILINIIFIKYIGLYAAAISTAISYFIMMVYRHYELKKYVKISYEKWMFLKMTGMFLLVTFIYYKNNLIFSVVGLFGAVLYAYLSNKKMINSVISGALKKIRKQ